MDDSSQFMQWALSTLQHEQPPPPTPAPAAAYDNNGCDTISQFPVLGYSVSVDSLVPGEPPAREGQRATNSWSSVDADSGSGSGGAGACVAAWSPTAMCATAAPSSCSSGTNNRMSWDFNSASAAAQLIIEPQQPNSAAAMAEGGGGGVPQMTQRGSLSPPTRRASAKISASSSSAPYSQDHIIAERKRREKINQRFIELSTVIPGLKKMDKATILSDATRYVRELQEKLKGLQEDGGSGRGRGMESAVLVKRPCIAAPDGDDDGGARSQHAAAAGPAATGNALPEIEARISDGNVVMVRVHCRDAKGVLVRLLAEVEELHLAITHTNVVQFSASVLIINIIAKVEQGFNTTADDIVGRLNAALHQCVRNSAEQARSCC
ncbi:hypothetical protein SEVIR_9G141800v4 [Setaria viridis]|uniref:BHLH domain-containing protein n=1 Tax=Setaria viridis TaxID=4556 RepID=A0A4U6SV24_SETVI|nr:transcription factor bHLH18-like [Setaria viridis]TKV92104.1 hypothetical protein SEVIR_9G141800v2 [Setaria viridis]